jgi:alginate O-acetyltransferase complex protein AlgI
LIISLPFFVALLIATALYWTLPGASTKTILLPLFSVSVIAAYDLLAGLLVIALTIVAWLFARRIEPNNRSKKLFHRAGILILLGCLLTFKYNILELRQSLSLQPGLWTEGSLSAGNILVPLGLSYLSFKYVSYLTDVYWGVVRAGTLLEVATYGSMFTMFSAGPIERFERFLPQLEKRPSRLTAADVETAARRIAFGLFKKLALADWIGYLIDPIWHAPGEHTGPILAAALLGYSAQIYLDFSAYSDIAVGGSRLFGFSIMENFDNPYRQVNIGQFWRHWHISLSDWIRDYVFFPLGGLSRNRLWNIVVVPILAMVLCGLWHGVSWNFVVWGFWHGAGISVYQVWSARKKGRSTPASTVPPPVRRFLAWLITFAFVSAGWIFFRGNELVRW